MLSLSLCVCVVLASLSHKGVSACVCEQPQRLQQEQRQRQHRRVRWRGVTVDDNLTRPQQIKRYRIHGTPSADGVVFTPHLLSSALDTRHTLTRCTACAPRARVQPRTEEQERLRTTLEHSAARGHNLQFGPHPTTPARARAIYTRTSARVGVAVV